MHLPATPTALLFAYAFLSNIALAVVPHEPAIIWYGPRLGVWTTTLVGTAGTLLAALAGHPVFAPPVGPPAPRTARGGGLGGGNRPARPVRPLPPAPVARPGVTPPPLLS